MSRKMQKPRLAPRFLQQERGEEKMKKIIWNRLSVLYPKDIKEEREKVLSWYEVGRGNPPGEKTAQLMDTAREGTPGPFVPTSNPGWNNR